MEELAQLENEIKYFELLNGGLTALKFLQNGEDVDVKYILRQTKLLKTLKLDFDKSTFFIPFLCAIASRQFITTFRENTDSIDFSKVEKDSRYIELKNELFGEYPDIPDNECDRILKSIANELAHGNVIKLFDFNKLTEYYRRLKYERVPNRVARVQFKKDLTKLFTGLLSPEFKFTSRFEKLPNGKVIKRQTPKIITLNLDFVKMCKLVFVADNASKTKKYTFNYDFNGDYSLFYTNEDLKTFIDEVEIYFGDKKITLDDNQKDDLFNIFQHYYITANSNRFNLNEIFNVCLERVLLDANLRKNELDGIEHFLVPFLSAHDSEDLQKIILSNCYEKDFNDLDTNRILYSYEIKNLYSELLITVLVNLLKQIENKNLYYELAQTDFIANLTADLTGKTETTLTEKDKLKIIKCIRNALTHNRYINNANKTIDLYDEKSKRNLQNTNQLLSNSSATSSHEKELDFKFGLFVEDLEEIKDLCLQVLTENYERILIQSKKQ